MFKFVPRPTFKTKVTVHVPGLTEPQVFTGHFTAMTRSETDVLQGPDVPRDQIVANNRTWLERIFTGWDNEVFDEAGQPMLFSDKTRDALLDADFVRAAVAIAYLAEVSGAARKN